MNKKVAVLLINWNSFDLTNDCIRSLKALTFSSYAIIVVDNGSADDSEKKLKEEHPDIILLPAHTNLGFAGGNNKGLAYSIENGYEYSILLNNDTFVEKNFLDILVKYMDQHPEVGIIQPKIFFNHDRSLLWDGGSYYQKFWGRIYTSGYNKPSTPQYNTIKEVDWVTGCAFLTRNSILKKTGLLADKLFIYYEDVDLSFRIKKTGHKLIYHPEAVIYHIAGMANKNKTRGKEGYVNPVVHYLGNRNKIWILKKYTPWYCIPGVLLFNIFYTFALITYFIVRMRFVKLRAALNGLKDGLFDSL